MTEIGAALPDGRDFGVALAEQAGVIDWPALRAIEAACPDLPLVLHGGSGIPLADRQALGRERSSAC